MAIANLVRLVLHGRLNGGEIWTCSVDANGGTPPADQAAFQDAVDGVVASGTFNGLVAWLASHNNAGFHLDGLTGYYYADYPIAATFTAEHVLSTAGSGSGAVLPNQVSLVATKLTGSAGRRNRGRMYLPFTAFNLAANGELLQADCDDASSAVVDFINAVNDVYSPDGACVASVVGSTTRPITQIKVDSRPDIQRRRANSQAVAFQTTADV
jgi:hypothetical protein